VETLSNVLLPPEACDQASVGFGWIWDYLILGLGHACMFGYFCSGLEAFSSAPPFVFFSFGEQLGFL